jgi:hypothetical protein
VEVKMIQYIFITALSVMAISLTSTVTYAADNFKRDFTYKVCARNNGDIFTLNVAMKNTGDRAEFGAVIYKNDGSVMRTFNNFFGSEAGPEWMRGPGEMKIGTKNNKCFSFSMQGKEQPDGNAVWIALKAKSPVTDNTNSNGLFVTSQMRLKQFTMGVQLTVTSPDGSTYKPQITGDFSDGASASPPQPAPDRPAHAPGVSFDVDENDFMISNDSWTQAPVLCFYSQPGYQGKEFCPKKNAGLLGQSSYLSRVRSMRIKLGYRVQIRAPDIEECNPDQEECLTSDPSDGDGNSTVTTLKPMPSISRDFRGFSYSAEKR